MTGSAPLRDPCQRAFFFFAGLLRAAREHGHQDATAGPHGKRHAVIVPLVPIVPHAAVLRLLLTGGGLTEPAP